MGFVGDWIDEGAGAVGDVWSGVTGSDAKHQIEGATMAGASQIKEAGIKESEAYKQGLAAQKSKLTEAMRVLKQEQPNVYYEVMKGKESLQPFQTAGSTATSALLTQALQGYKAPTMEEVQSSPGYQFRLGEAQKAIERSAAARGMLLSGRSQKELGRYISDYASQEYEKEAERRRQEYLDQAGLLSTLSSTGLSAGTSLGSLSQALASLKSQGVDKKLGLISDMGTLEAARKIQPAQVLSASEQAAAELQATGQLSAAQAKQGTIGGLIQLGGQIGKAAIMAP